NYGNFFYGISYGGNAPGAGIPDKGFYGNVGATFPHSLQMLQKDGDFEQVGELLNVWLFGHELKLVPSGAGPGRFDYQETTKTFSEFMADANLVGDDERVNRLRVEPVNLTGGQELSPIIGVGTANPNDPLHAIPPLPAGARVLDLFVCDGNGVNNSGFVLNAAGYSGRATPGLINVNTAPVEVMRALPHLTRLIHEINSPSNNPYVRLPEAIVQYREQYNGEDALLPGTNPTGIPKGANYSDRDSVATGLRSERGLASIGELMLLTKASQVQNVLDPLKPNANWRVDFAAEVAGSTQISTDLIDTYDPALGIVVPDAVAADVEERNLLFAGISNLITTRSDMFTVYFKIRSFRQNPVTGAWDATNPEYIVDDSRYVMLVDRSEVNHPNDKPRILYLEKLPK
ncbi:MAG: hypothetical protein IH888_12200, partial [Planctomycetes bacterium]|nr:hypothetical protein [Planctomycetota bacterium]